MKKSERQAWEVGAGVAAAALAAAAGAYLLSGKKGAKRRARAKAWVDKARREAGRQMKAAKKIGAAEYARIATQAVRRYGAMEKATAPEIAKAIKDLHAEWKHIRKQAESMGPRRKSHPAARRPARKTRKKSRS